MLKRTFMHISGVSRATEEKFWSEGISSWDDFLKYSENLNTKTLNISRNKIKMISSEIKCSITALKKSDYNCFITSMQGRDHWRAYPEMKGRCCFLDIETTGLDKRRDDITLIGIYDGKKSRIFIQGKNIDDFKKEIEKYDCIISFNGRCFDIPFLKAKFPDVDFEKFHIDLRFAMKELGFSGGLKKIEKEIGISREDDILDVDGFEAVRLWYKYLRGDKQALDLLVKYNIADIENLKVMMDFAYGLLEKKYYKNTEDEADTSKTK